MMRPGLLLGTVVLATLILPGTLARAQVSARDAATFFDLGRQAVVLSQKTLFRELEMFRALELRKKAPSDGARGWLGGAVEPMPVEAESWRSFKAHYSITYLRPFALQGDLYKDRAFLRSNYFGVRGRYEKPGEKLALSGGIEGFYNTAISTQLIDMTQLPDSGVPDETPHTSYGSDFQGSLRLGARYEGWVDWRTQVFFHKKSQIDPNQLYIDGRGAVVYPDKRESAGVAFSLFDKFDLLPIGALVQILHGEDAPWNPSKMVEALLEEKLYFPELHSFLLVGSRNFDGLTRNFVEIDGGYASVDTSGSKTGLQAGNIVSLHAGARLGDGGLYAWRAAGMALGAKLELTRQLKRHDGTGDELKGFAFGYTGGNEHFQAEIAYYKNYLDHIDLVPAFRDTAFLKLAVGGQF